MAIHVRFDRHVPPYAARAASRGSRVAVDAALPLTCLCLQLARLCRRLWSFRSPDDVASSGLTNTHTLGPRLSAVTKVPTVVNSAIGGVQSRGQDEPLAHYMDEGQLSTVRSGKLEAEIVGHKRQRLSASATMLGEEAKCARACHSNRSSAELA